MNNAQKIEVFKAAILSVSTQKWGQQLLTANDVAKALGLKCLVGKNNNFELVKEYTPVKHHLLATVNC
jgi:hypothetical protein